MALDREKRLLNAVAKAEKRIGDAREARRAAVIEALEAGVSGTVIAQVLGVTRHRVYQIRDGK